MRVALIGDVHANLPALEAVLEHAHRLGVDAVWNVGDLVGYGPQPDEVIRRLRREHAVSIAGNYDLKVLAVGKGKPPKTKAPEKRLAFRWAWEHLSKSSRDYLKGLAEEARFELEGRRILLTHGSPADREEYVGEQTSDKRLGELAEIAGADIIVSGHKHRPARREHEGCLFVNTGSVGRPDDSDPRASYAILDIKPKLFRVTHHRVRYEVGRTVAQIRRHKLPELFAQMLIKGESLDRLQGGYANGERQPFDAAAGGGDLRLEAVFDLARSCDYEVEHTHQVTRLALMLFNETQAFHRLGPQERFYLQCAGLLHDIGYVAGSKSHHKQALKIVLDSELLPFGRRERLVIGSIARYHRKALPGARHKHFARLDRDDRHRVRVLAAILSLVDSLDSSHRSLVHTLKCSFTPRKAIIHCVVLGLYEEWRQRVFEKGLLFEQVFGRKLVLEWEHKVRPGTPPGHWQPEAPEPGPVAAPRHTPFPDAAPRHRTA
ncbi:MAG: YfcE family phosphodiesterase [bacterium]